MSQRKILVSSNTSTSLAVTHSVQSIRDAKGKMKMIDNIRDNYSACDMNIQQLAYEAVKTGNIDLLQVLILPERVMQNKYKERYLLIKQYESSIRQREKIIASCKKFMDERLNRSNVKDALNQYLMAVKEYQEHNDKLVKLHEKMRKYEALLSKKIFREIPQFLKERRELANKLIADQNINKNIEYANLSPDLRVGNEQDNLLQIAIRHRQFDIVEFLLYCGANVNYVNNIGQSALMEAIDSNDLISAHLLFQFGLTVHNDCVGVNGSSGRNLLHLAIEQKDYNLARDLMQDNVDLFQADRLGITPWSLVLSKIDRSNVNENEFFKEVLLTFLKRHFNPKNSDLYSQFESDIYNHLVNQIEILNQQNNYNWLQRLWYWIDLRMVKKQQHLVESVLTSVAIATVEKNDDLIIHSIELLWDDRALYHANLYDRIIIDYQKAASRQAGYTFYHATESLSELSKNAQEEQVKYEKEKEFLNIRDIKLQDIVREVEDGRRLLDEKVNELEKLREISDKTLKVKNIQNSSNYPHLFYKNKNVRIECKSDSQLKVRPTININE